MSLPKILLILALPVCLSAAEKVLERGLQHLRIDGPREWSTFPEMPLAAGLEVSFESEPNRSSWTLRLRQQDVKENWAVTLNGRELGRLRVDENDMVVYFPVPPGAVRKGSNVLSIAQDTSRRRNPDDIRVGEIRLDDRPLEEALSGGVIAVTVHDQATDEPIPARITVVNIDGALQSVYTEEDNLLAVRPGVIFTASGKASFSLPKGDYMIYAGRGFEYSLAKREVRFTGQADAIGVRLQLERQVPTEGWVASDTHVHTFTKSRHGDATLEERMVTLAAEGVELPIATDHNQQVDYGPLVREMGLGRYFTPIVGNEVTTPTAHFNVFPVEFSAPPPDHRSPDWAVSLGNIFRTPGVKVAILNHARDLHSGVRPFDPSLFNAETGESLDDRPFRFNAMETVNSGATQTDPLQLFRDWMALLRRGLKVTPVGSSDSHDVARHFVGQGRTYIRVDDSDPGAIDVEQAVFNFLQGRVMVSYGLLAELTVDGKYGPGETVPVMDDEVDVRVRVLGPDWIDADRVMLFQDGALIRETSIRGLQRPGVIWQGGWRIPRPEKDSFLVAIAMGPGIEGPYWRTAKPYQPDTPDPTTYVIGASGAVWLAVE